MLLTWRITRRAITLSHSYGGIFMRKATVSERLRYLFDNLMSKGPIALIVWLFVLSTAMILTISGLVVATGLAPNNEGFTEMAWMSLMRTLDAGTMGGDTGNWGFLLAMFGVTLGGVFTVSMLIGILTSGIENKLQELRKGRSRVLEQNHTVILGWSPQVFAIISELVIANANQPRNCIVILAPEDKVEMEDAVRDHAGKTGRTRIICRSGDPLNLNDLELASPHTARAVIILPPAEAPDPDFQVIKAILALTNNPNRRPEPYHIVAVIREAKNVAIAKMVGHNEVELVLAGNFISRITVQTCRQSGLSTVYTELLDFGGDEIYFSHEPRLVGKTFGEALLAYEDSAVIGLYTAAGEARLNPPMETVIQTGDQIIAISADDDTVVLSERTEYPLDPSAIRQPSAHTQHPERTLILGWNDYVPTIVADLDAYVAHGSEIVIVAEAPRAEADLCAHCAELHNQAARFQAGDATDRRTLDALDIPSYDHVLVISDTLDRTPQETDARTLVTLLHLRDIAEKTGHSFSIVSEMLDARNRDLAEITHADDFIVSDRLISLTLSQLSENKALGPVFTDLFDPEGSEIYLKPAASYVQPGRPVTFYTVVEAARQRGEVAIGYRLTNAKEQAEVLPHHIRLNPRKAESVTFTEKDKIIVLAES